MSHSGVCKGGPWNGQSYVHWSDKFPLMKPVATGPGIFTREPRRTTIESVVSGEYHHDGHGTWVWVPS